MRSKWFLALVPFVALTAFVIPAQAADNAVTVNDTEFAPAEITVPVGTAVTWKNASQNAPHSAKAQDGSFDTGYIMPGAEGTATMSTAGDFQYFCEPHPWKKGTVHVK